MSMTTNRPYLIRAIYDWILDNHCTPHLVVAADQPNVVVPEQYVEDGRIVLNIAPSAVRGLELGNDEILFSARFGGRPMTVSVPPSAVIGIYARENGHGMIFPEDEPVPADDHAEPDNGDDEPTPPSRPPRQRPKLKVVK